MNGSCHPGRTCQSSLECSGALDGKTICDTSLINGPFCAACAKDADCGTGETCAALSIAPALSYVRACVPTCSSDNQCTPIGKVCGSKGYCTDCRTDADCPVEDFCAPIGTLVEKSNGLCLHDACTAGAILCSGNDVYGCDPRGSQLTLRTTCTGLTECDETAFGGCASLNSGSSHCANGYFDAGEADSDCGGTDCPGCPAGSYCAVPSDCASGSCGVGAKCN